MKKNSLTTAIIAGVAGVAGLAGVAHAVNLNPDGIGQVLLYPYYTTNGGNSTLISVVNTSDVGKAVKVRFLEALNSKEVLDFNLYLSPFDVWTANVHLDDGKPGIRTSDKSCIAPNYVMPDPATGQARFTEFLNYEFEYWRPDLLGVGGHANSPVYNAARKNQGHIEIIEMGDLGGLAHRYALHGMHGGEWKPENCAWFETQWTTMGTPTNPTWLRQSGGTTTDGNNFGRGLHSVYPPGSGYWTTTVPAELEFNDRGGAGGIFGSAYIVNGEEGTAYSYNAEAINGFYTISDADTGNAADQNLHHAPGTVYPSLWQAANYYDVGTNTYYSTATVFNAAGESNTLAFARSTTLPAPDAVSAVLSARHIMNEYAVNGITNAISDWVVTFPTKQLHVYRTRGAVPASTCVTGVPGLAPFSCAQGAGLNGSAGDNVFTGYWPEEFSVDYWDREELEPSTPPDVGLVSPLPPPGQRVVLAFGAEANTLTFIDKALISAEDEEKLEYSVLKAPPSSGGGYYLGIEENFHAGWARIGFDTQSVVVPAPAVTVPGAETTAFQLNGLPVVGFWAARHINHAAGDGISAYYNIIHRHRVTRDIGAAQTPAP
ncbi:hypothetical protein [Denitratimonas sp. CY0512]|uniref:hypothetical protein n=1 Tax=Denitratimonas sp. CY0512 TaxID=3131940 RepID=UPI00309993BF